MEFARRGVRVNALCPGPVDTPLLRELYANDPAKAARRLIHLPMGRFADAREIASAALFLASDESSYITASTFMVDGGLSGAYVTPPNRRARAQDDRRLGVLGAGAVAQRSQQRVELGGVAAGDPQQVVGRAAEVQHLGDGLELGGEDRELVAVGARAPASRRPAPRGGGRPRRGRRARRTR